MFRTIEVSSEGAELSKARGFLEIRSAFGSHRVDISTISALVISSRGARISTSAIEALAELGVVISFCGSNYSPIAAVVPGCGHALMAERFDAQVTAKLATQKRIWAQVVSHKILQQAETLQLVGRDSPQLLRYARTVKAGDASNNEAHAARVYWGKLFGDAFRRDQDLPGINGALNYGYAVVRSAVMRSLTACGLHVSLGVFHRSKSNPGRLADDMMEPYRPVVDRHVYEAVAAAPACFDAGLESHHKRALAELLNQDFKGGAVSSPLYQHIDRYCRSLANVYLGVGRSLESPFNQGHFVSERL